MQGGYAPPPRIPYYSPPTLRMSEPRVLRFTNLTYTLAGGILPKELSLLS